MPEHAEIRIMANYINTVTRNKTFVDVFKNPVNKQQFDRSNFPNRFILRAISRGKEIQLRHIPVSNDGTLDESKMVRLTITMGMSGNFVFVEDGRPPKWPMLTWTTDKLDHLDMIDHRRFAKWKVRDFNRKRGYDVVIEHRQFCHTIIDMFDKKHKHLDKPLCEVLLDQRYFNGIGNYLIAEILGRLNVNPFQSLLKLSRSKLNELLHLCFEIPENAFLLGGGQLKDWKNQDDVDKHSFDSWKKFYHNPKCNNVITPTKRRFWYAKKWQKYCKYDIASQS